MKANRLISLVGFLTFTILLYPPEVRSQGLVVDCGSGGTIRRALSSLKPGDTLTVRGTCNESVGIQAEVSRITLDGRGSAVIQSPNPTQNVIAIQGREITVRGFTLSGGNNGIIIQRGGTAVVDGNIIRSNARQGILLGPGSSAAIINNTIENNQWGITVDDNSSARIGWQVPTVLGLPNNIRNNTDSGIFILHNSSARIIGATISNNGGDGIQIERASHADVTDNIINGNLRNGIAVSGSSGVDLDFGRSQGVIRLNRTDAGASNGEFGIDASLGAYVSGSLGTLAGAKGATRFDDNSINGFRPTVSSVSFSLRPVFRDERSASITLLSSPKGEPFNSPGLARQRLPWGGIILSGVTLKGLHICNVEPSQGTRSIVAAALQAARAGHRPAATIGLERWPELESASAGLVLSGYERASNRLHPG